MSGALPMLPFSPDPDPAEGGEAPPSSPLDTSAAAALLLKSGGAGPLLGGSSVSSGATAPPPSERTGMKLTGRPLPKREKLPGDTAPPPAAAAPAATGGSGMPAAPLLIAWLLPLFSEGALDPGSRAPITAAEVAAGLDSKCGCERGDAVEPVDSRRPWRVCTFGRLPLRPAAPSDGAVRRCWLADGSRCGVARGGWGRPQSGWGRTVGQGRHLAEATSKTQAVGGGAARLGDVRPMGKGARTVEPESCPPAALFVLTLAWVQVMTS